MGARDDDIDGGCDLGKMFWHILPGILGALLAIVIVVPLLYWPFLWSEDEGKIREYRVAVAGFSGLDLTLPTLDLTIRVAEPRKYSATCFERGTAASVSYAGVALARGPVAEFCAKSDNVTEERSVMAWGNAVTVPQFARERLAEELRRGDAALDVALVAPARYCRFCQQRVILCTPGLGRNVEPSPPCRVAFQYPDLPDEYPAGGRRPGRKLLKPGDGGTEGSMGGVVARGIGLGTGA